MKVLKVIIAIVILFVVYAALRPSLTPIGGGRLGDRAFEDRLLAIAGSAR